MKADLPNIEIRSAVICEQIRKEVNGKDILIGVYSADLIVASFPAIVPLSFWLMLFADRPGPLALEFRILGVDGAAIAGFDASGDITAKGFGTLSAPILPVPLSGPGSLKFEWRRKAADVWQGFSELEVKLNPGATNASPLPSSQTPIAS
jgi:hypothetical protein